MVILAFILIALFFLAPLGGLLAHIDWAVVEDLVASRSFQKSLWVTIASGVGGACISLVLGALFARQFAYYEWRKKRLYRLLLIVPYLVPNFVLASAFVMSWNPATGALNALARFPFGLYGLWGMIVLFGICHLPVAFLVLEERFRRIDPAWREAARLSGASSAQVLARIELPTILPSLVSVASLCFALNISAFAIPAWIGAPARVYPLTYRIYQLIQRSGPEGISEAAGVSLLLFILAIPPLVLGAWAQRRQERVTALAGRAPRFGDSRQGKVGFTAFLLGFWSISFIGWIAPLGTLLASTLVPPGCLQQSGLGCLGAFTIRSYSYVLFELAETRIAFQNSFVFGVLSAALILLLSVAMAIPQQESSTHRRESWRWVSWIAAVPLAVPGAVIALGLIVTASGKYGVNLYNTPWIVVYAYILKHLSLAQQPIESGVTGIGRSLLEAARISGASTPKVWSRVIMPILKPDCIGGFALVLIPIMGELTMSVLLASPSFRSIGTVLFDLQDYADQAAAGAMSVLLVCFVFALNELARRLSGGKYGF